MKLDMGGKLVAGKYYERILNGYVEVILPFKRPVSFWAVQRQDAPLQYSGVSHRVFGHPSAHKNQIKKFQPSQVPDDINRNSGLENCATVCALAGNILFHRWSQDP